MNDFSYKALPWNIIFSAGSLNILPSELDKMGKQRVLILTTPNHAKQGGEVAALLGDRVVGLFDQAAMHVPASTLEAAIEMARVTKADCTVALGGGSTTGLGKALAVKEGLDNIAIPTTYAGSEMTDIWAVTEADRKVTARDHKAVPSLVLYDPELTLTLPPKFSAASGLNAMAQAVVNVATDFPNPIISSLALDGIRALASSLPVIMQEPNNIEARSQALYGASMAGGALGMGVTSLHHRLCHTFGGTFNTPHAEIHAILLAHSVAYNAKATPLGTAQVAEAMGVDDAAQGIYELAKQLGITMSLKDLGISEADLNKAVAVTLEKPLINSEPVTAERLRQLLSNAWRGNPPHAIKA